MNPTVNKELKLWQILVPTVSNEGKPFRTRYHRVWDSKVMEITGGMTILTPVIGKWAEPEAEIVSHQLAGLPEAYIERMIPVQIACTEKEIKDIALMTKKYYNQLAVFYFLLSDSVGFV